MTQEDKLKEAKRLYQTANADQKYVLESLFPELKESEENRIKSDIQYAVRCAYGDKSEQTNKILAWLEKQGEQKLYVNDNAKEMFIKALERVEEQNSKGYKLTDCDKNSWWEDFKAYTSCTIEQKPAAWSDEDEKMFEHIIAKATLHFSSINYLDEEEINFLKSLRHQPHWKPSDEQMVALQEAMNIVGILTIIGSEINSLYQDLKKLKE